MEILKLREHSELASEAAEWFHSKWDIPVEEYAGSIQECLTGKSIVPQWYVAVENQQIIGGIGVIENDFHTLPATRRIRSVTEKYFHIGHRARTAPHSLPLFGSL